MWALANKTSYSAERNWIRDRNGLHWWLVAVRATFTIDERGVVHLADEQLPPLLTPEHHEAPGESSLRCDSDLLGLKPTTDVVVVGSAHAPKGKAATAVEVVLRVGRLEKKLVVFGERVYYEGVAGLTTTKPQPFIHRPIRYEFAFGGGDTSNADPSQHRIDERNPVGLGYGISNKALVNTAAHTIEYPTGNPSRRGPAGFGAIDRGWLPRRTLAGTYDAHWVKTKKPLLADDYNPAFALCAPVDQRPQQPLVGGERVGLFNLTPQGSTVFDLPRIALRLTSRFGRDLRPHDAPLLTTVLLEPDEHRVSIVWQSGLRVVAPDTDFLDETTIEQLPA